MLVLLGEPSLAIGIQASPQVRTGGSPGLLKSSGSELCTSTHQRRGNHIVQGSHLSQFEVDLKMGNSDEALLEALKSPQ